MPTQEHRQALLTELRRRREVRELQAAQLGIDAPPHVKVELAELNAQIAALEAEDRSLVPSELLDSLGASGRIQLVLAELKNLKQNVSERFDREREDILERFDTWEKIWTRTQEQNNRWLIALTLAVIFIAMGFVAILARGGP